MDVSDAEDIDFEDISQHLERPVDFTKRRWEILIKGLGGVTSGKIFKARDLAKKLI